MWGGFVEKKLEPYRRLRLLAGALAPRSDARKLARGMRFLRTPGIRRQLRNPHPEGVSRSPRTLSRVRLFLVSDNRGLRSLPLA